MTKPSTTRTLGLCAAASLGLFFAPACSPQTNSSADSPAAANLAALTAGKLLPRFPDFGFLPKPGTGAGQYAGRIFKLSQEYPKQKPEMEPAVQKILAIDYRKNWEPYMVAVRDYILEGNIGHAGGTANDFYLEDNKVRRWFHVPWQHYGALGREGIHGLTKEGPVNPFVLDPAQKNQWQTYAVGFYNAPGGYMIGKTWADADNPDISVMQSEGFPEGTIVGKVLFTTAPISQAPFLKNPIEWDAYTAPSFADDSSARVMNKVRFVQMDIMVRDSRAATTGGWVFGTFAYNGALARKNQWLNIVPVGLMWGNDPTVTANITNAAPTKTITNPALKECIINPSPDLPPAHLGYGLRLDGPVDDTRSSCMSCHSTAQFPAISPILPFLVKQGDSTLKPGTAEWMRWFRNVPCKTPFDGQAVSADYSLQLAASIQNFLLARSAETKGLYEVQYWRGQPVQPILGMRGASPAQQQVQTKKLQMMVRRH
jgi:hypothetical protein